MFENTRQRLDLNVKRIEFIGKVGKFLFNYYFILYYALSIALKIGYLLPNVILLGITLFNLIITTEYRRKSRKQRKKEKKEYKRTKKIINNIRIIIKTIILLANFYYIYLTINNPSIILIVGTTLSFLIWAGNIAVEIAKKVIFTEIDKLKEAFHKDVEQIKVKTKETFVEAYDKTKDFIGNTVETVKETTTETVSKIKNFFHKKEDKKQIEK